jgi:site-specific DNA-methyltransferase (adenine-specific)
VSFADFNLLADLRSKKVFKSTYELIWHKTMAVGFLQANQRPLTVHEYIGVFAENRNSTTYNPQKTKGVSYVSKSERKKTHYNSPEKRKPTINNGDRHPTTIIKKPIDADKLHPTQKPVDLLQWLIKTYSNEGDTVLDCFMGSGSTGVAAFNNKRRFIGCELDANYFEIAKNRLENNKHDLVGFMNNTDCELERLIDIDGVQYGLEPNLSKIAYGAYLDIVKYDTFTIDENWASIMSILYRPVVKKQGSLYDIKDYDGNIDAEKFLSVPMNVHFGALFFFVRLSTGLPNDILKSMMDLEIIPHNIKSILDVNGKITHPLSNSQTEISE